MTTQDAVAPRRRSFVAGSVYLFERLLPDPFVIAIGLTFAVAVAALLFAPKGDLVTVVTSWYTGVFGIVGFAFQMVMILVTGHAVAHAPIVQRGLKRLVATVSTPNQAVVLTFLVAAVASWLNWGFGLVVGAILAREVAKRIRLDFGWLVAAAYSGWVIWASGPSSSIALSQATHGNALNIVEKLTGKLLPFGETVFTSFNLVPTILVVIAVPIAFILLKPREDEIVAFVPGPDDQAAPAATKAGGHLRRDRQPVAGRQPVPGFAGARLSRGELDEQGRQLRRQYRDPDLPDLWCRPARHSGGLFRGHEERRQAVGSMILQYPIYGGIMGMIDATGLAAMISKFFVVISTAHTLPFWTYFASLFITFLVPSGGGHWAVQGPFAIPAAIELHASIPAVTMSVAMGEQVSNMMQPFWALPVVAMAGIGIQRVLGFTVVTFFVAGIIYGGALLVLV